MGYIIRGFLLGAGPVPYTPGPLDACLHWVSTLLGGDPEGTLREHVGALGMERGLQGLAARMHMSCPGHRERKLAPVNFKRLAPITTTHIPPHPRPPCTLLDDHVRLHILPGVLDCIHTDIQHRGSLA